jgi:phosphoglycolate phosphatase
MAGAYNTAYRASMPGPLGDARAIVFDLDGTLVDSLDDIGDHLNAALGDHGFPARTRAEIRAWVGYGAENLVARAVPRPPDHVGEVLARFRERYRERPVVKTRVYPGLDHVLDAIAPGRQLAVLSNKPNDLTVRIAAELLARWPFAVVHGQQAGRPHKPDPASVLAVIAELGVGVGECVLIGDSEVDVATARAAGMRGVGVSWGLRDVAIVIAAGPDHLVDTPAELAALF